MSLAFGLHKLPSQELKRLLRALHRGALPSPITRAALIEAAFGHVEAHLDVLVGRDLAAAKALLVAVLAERGTEPEASAAFVFTGPEAPGTRSRDTIEQVRELLAGATQSLALYGLRAGERSDETRALLRTVNALMLGRGVKVRLVFDGGTAAHSEGMRDSLRELVARELRTCVGLELFVAVGARLRARVALVDEERALVTSAELTGREEEGYIDIGVLLSDRAYVRALSEEWGRLLAIGACVPIAI